jgi:hypothetical protein
MERLECAALVGTLVATALSCAACGCQVQDIQPSTLPKAQVGQAYAVTFSCSEASASWSLTDGVLPPGLTLSAGGSLGGTPSAAGTYGIQVGASASCWMDGAQFLARDYTIFVDP